jgi:hypothetical protein
LIPLIVLLFTVALMFHVPIQSAMHSGEKENISIGGVFFTGFVMTILLSCFWLVFVARGLKIKGSALLSKTPSLPDSSVPQFMIREAESGVGRQPRILTTPVAAPKRTSVAHRQRAWILANSNVKFRKSVVYTMKCSRR